MNKTINFMYWLYNHVNLTAGLVETFGTSLGNHFAAKLKDGGVASVLGMMMEMSDDNKEAFLEWIDKNYNYKGK